MPSGFIGKARFGSGGFAGAGAAAGGGGGGFANVALLLHMEGVDGATGAAFIDSSSYAHTMESGNFAKISTDDHKFGTTSLSTGTFGYVQVTYGQTFGNEFQIVDGKDFTIEAFVRAAAAPSSPDGCIFGIDHADASIAAELGVETTTGKLMFSTQGGPASLKGSANICDDAWHHVAIVRAGTVYSLYTDGARVATVTDAGTIVDSHGAVCVGKNSIGGTRLTNAFIDEVRFTNGTAVYSGATYVVPTGAFPDA